METANLDQANAWNGDEGALWTEHADRYERATSRHWQHFLDTVPVGTDDAVVDIGCGTGTSTRDLARIASRGLVLGVDLSAAMLQLARERTAADGLVNVDYLRADAQVHDFGGHGLDLAVSSFGAMFFNDPVAALANIRYGLGAGGRLALLAWRELPRNEWLSAIRAAFACGRDLPLPPPDAPTPFSLADPDRVRLILTAAGYDDIAFDPVDEPIDLGTEPDDAFDFVQTLGIVRGLSQDLDYDDHARALDQLRRTIDTHHGPHGVLLGSSAWIITARRSTGSALRPATARHG